MLTRFYQKVYNLLKKIPKGKITTYQLLAKAVGKPKNWRQIARILAHNPYPGKFPCYKVVKSNGEIGGYFCGIKKKKKLLQKDGIIIKRNKIQTFKKYLFKF